MSHEWETGFMVRQPSWHRKERAVLPDGLLNWDDARKAAGLDWDYYSQPARLPKPWALQECSLFSLLDLAPTNYQVIYRDDLAPATGTAYNPAGLMAIQPNTYQLITMAEFGQVMNTVLSHEMDAALDFEALFSLYGGRRVVALIRLADPIQIGGVSSAHYLYLCFTTNFDGQGGLTVIPTVVRVQCANTLRYAEMTDAKRVGTVIRHTANWTERLGEVRNVIAASRRDALAWATLATKLSGVPARPRDVDRYLTAFLPISDDMGDRQRRNTEESRNVVRSLLVSPSTEGIAGTYLGVLMAATEFVDHSRLARSDDSRITRALLTKAPQKARAVAIACAHAKVERPGRKASQG